MHISKLKIKNFKCFDEVEINFDPNFNLIIGENNSGKSTIFEALRLWYLALQQFLTARTRKEITGKENYGFYEDSTNEGLLKLKDLSFLRIDKTDELLKSKTNKSIIARHFDNKDLSSFIIEIEFQSDDNTSSIPIFFKPNTHNTLNCKIDKSSKAELIEVSKKLSSVMGIATNDTFKNRIRLAYIPPKFTLPSKEVLFSEKNIFINDKLVYGESQDVLRNILHNWCEFEYQRNTKQIDPKKKKYLEDELINRGIDKLIIQDNFKDLIKPYIENIIGYNLSIKRNEKSDFLKKIEIGLGEILNQDFYFKSKNNPIKDQFLYIYNTYDETEISQLGSGTINILNILVVLNYNNSTIHKAATKCNILLLDEPDSHLHPNIQKKLFTYLVKEAQDQNTQILIVSHNSSLISQFDNVLFIGNNQKVINPIPLDDYLENHLKQIDEHHYNVMKDLHNAKKEKEEEKKKREEVEKQLNELKNIEIPLVFTEGPSDVTILENAFKKLYPQESIKFQLVNGFSCTQLKNTFENLKTFEKNNLPHIAIFDFDTAYDQWNGLWKNKFNFVEENPYKALSKKHNNFNAYAILLPVPEIELIKNQVIDPDNEKNNFGNKSVLQIEHLFYDIYSCRESFETKNIVGGGKCIVFKNDKITFAQYTKELSKEDFKNFVPLFEKIAEIIGVELPKVEFDD